MNYPETLNYLYSRLPMFTKIGASAIKKDLTNTLLLCGNLNNPEKKFNSVHIAGTNGKGSVSHMLAAVMQTAGYKTGLYTSPHLRDFRERIRINGEMISEDAVVEFVESQKAHIEKIEPSFFEVTVAMAFNYFAEQKVDIAIIETGLGGRLDSTNVITPSLSVITNIGYDHMNILGNTLPEIAVEKAGIIKPGIPVVISQKQDELKHIFMRKANDSDSEIIFASDEWNINAGNIVSDEISDFRTIEVMSASGSSIPESFNLDLDLTGTYQMNNVKAVLSSVMVLNKKGYSISQKDLYTALKNVKKLTGLLGRWQTISREPLVICDTGHNEDGIREVLKNIRQTPFKTLRMVIGMVKDKDISKVISLLPKNAVYYFCQPALERAKPVEELAAEAYELGLKGSVFSSVQEALLEAKKDAEDNDLIFVGGSTFVVAEVV